GPLRHGATSARDPTSQLERPAVRRRDPCSVPLGGLAVRLDDAKGVEAGPYGRACVDRAQGLRDAAERLRLPDLLRRHDLALDEARDEVALGLDEGDHLRSDTDRGRGE